MDSVRNPGIRTVMLGLLLVLTGVLCLYPRRAGAVAPAPGLLERLRSEGRLESYLRIRRAAEALGVCAPADVKRASMPWAAGITANYNVLCILVDFSDNPSSGGSLASTPADFDSVLFSTGRNPTGSFKEYYNEVSYGQMNVIGTVVGWYRMPQPYSYYMNGTSGIGSYPRDARSLVETAIDSAEAGGINFAQFDNNGDGYVDGVMVVVAGTGAEETGDTNSIHSHRFSVQNPRHYDGVTIADYTIQPEESTFGGGRINAIGVFCHEWGHILGLLDLYDLDNCDTSLCPAASSGLGYWSLMALGNWLNSSQSPAHLDAWSRIRAAFAAPINLLSNQVGVTIPSVETSPTIYRLWTGGAGGLEYFLVENRNRSGFDMSTPGKGLLIYHVDESVPDNRNQWVEGDSSTLHYKVAVEQADGIFALEKNINDGDATDPYFSDSAGFDQLSYPSSHAYSGTATQVAVWNISAAGATMTADLDVLYSRPFLQASNYVIDDPLGNGNGVPEPGETFQITLDLTNRMLTASNVSVTLRAPGSALVLVDTVFQVASLATDATVNSSATPFTIAVPGNYRSRVETFEFAIAAEGGIYHWTDTLKVAIGPPHFLVVDDDRGALREDHLLTALDDLDEHYRHWDVNVEGLPPADTLLTYPTVIWMTGDTNMVSPSPAAVAAMQTYLDSSGHLFLTGQDIAENISRRADSTFLYDYLGVRFAGNETGWLVLVDGVAGDPIGDSLKVAAAGSDGDGNQKSVDRLELTPGSTAVVSYTYAQSGQNAAVHVDNGYRAVLFGFGFEAISSVQFGFNTRVEVLRPVINWLDGTLTTGVFDEPDDNNTPVAETGLPRSFALSQNYPNPFNAGTIIPFDLTTPGPRRVRLEVFNVLGRRVRLLIDEVLAPGVYRIAWNGDNDDGSPVSSGVYLYRVAVVGETAVARRMVLLK